MWVQKAKQKLSSKNGLQNQMFKTCVNKAFTQLPDIFDSYMNYMDLNTKHVIFSTVSFYPSFLYLANVENV